ncbi:MAG: STAS/SEC14 domain-containing protein [Bacteroidota bacterium]|nr:STAS/SEC14 domain-containing protein [Bacteroidota bacterium]
MKQEIYKSKFTTLSYHEDLNLMEQKWHNINNEMTDEDYKTEMKIFLSKFHEDTDRFIVDTQNIDMLINTDLQKWLGEMTAPKLVNKVKKAAFLVSSDIFLDISIEQANASNPLTEIKTEYFDNALEAIKWVASD